NAQAEDVQIPTPSGDIYVQDFAKVLTETERTELINLGRNIENQTTAQIAVLTVETIGDRPIEDFANEAFRQYGIGNKKENNGVLLVLSMQERKVRIEVGYGLEGRIPDGKAGRILDESAIPYLKNQQPNRAVVETYKSLANEVLAEYGKGGEISKQSPPTGDKGIGIPAWLLVIVVIVVVFLDFKFFGGTLTYLLLSIISRGGGRGGGGGSRGGGGGSSGGGGAGRGW
ncbi:MAG: TPM domain-containing protein, partial [Bacillus sp. (in: firmicutes)]